MTEDRVKQLAETLRRQGLAASMYEAMEKARAIMNVKSQIGGEAPQQKTEPSPEPVAKEDIDNNIGDMKKGEEIVNELNKTAADRSHPDYNVAREDLTVNDLMREVGVSEDQIKEQEKEKIEHIKEDIIEVNEDILQAHDDPGKIAEVKEDIAHVNEEIGKIAEERGADNEQEITDQAQEKTQDRTTDNQQAEETERQTQQGKDQATGRQEAYQQNQNIQQTQENRDEDIEKELDSLEKESQIPAKDLPGMEQSKGEKEEDDRYKEEKKIDLSKVFGKK